MKTFNSITGNSDYLESTSLSDAEKWQLHRKRVLFGKRQPQLSDFVACGSDGLPIEKPSEHLENRTLYYQELEAYQQALDKVLFKGFFVSANNGNVVITNGSISILFSIRNFIKIIESNQRITSLESLTPYNLELTENENKIIGV